MKKDYSGSWKRSTQPRKQRKYRHNAPLNARHNLMSAHLSAELRKLHKKRSITLRKNDIVKILRGNFRGKTGKVTSVNTKKFAAYVEGAEASRRDGTRVATPINVSNLMIIELDAQERKRLKKNG